jgi:ubiquinone/menaquinone biosynthesis C-methylase UbiE
MRRPHFIARQGRRPTGLLGEVVGRIMAHETAAANRVALDLLDLRPGDQVLEVGFGHGRSLAAAAAKVANGFVAGIDHSEVMLRIARSRNASVLRSGRMELTLGGSERIPHPDGRFNKVFAVHTIYFWSDPQRQIEEIGRIMSNEGRLVVCYRPSDDHHLVAKFPKSIYHIRSIEEVENLVAKSGLHRIHTTTHSLSSSLCAWTVAYKISDGSHCGHHDSAGCSSQPREK